MQKHKKCDNLKTINQKVNKSLNMIYNKAEKLIVKLYLF